MLVLRPEEVEGLVTMKEAIEAVDKAFADWGLNAHINLTRRRLHSGDARLNTMPAAFPSKEKIGLRIQTEILAVNGGVQTYPSRSPLVDVLFDTRSAAPLALILSSTQRGMTADGIPLRTSDLMTATISAVGSKWMSRGESGELALLGSGKQARNHLIAMKAIRDLKQVRVFSPTRANRERFAAEMAETLALRIIPVENCRKAIEQADMVLAATNTNLPVFSGEWLREGTHVTSIVGSNVGMVEAGVIGQKRRELDDATLTRADVIGIASRELAVQDQQGDIYDQVEAGKLSWDDIADLREIVGGQKPGRRSPGDITVFKNNGGQGIAELAIADLILTRAREKKLGIEVTWGEGY
ncbi:MAG TPA: ornithine cyclodeaminase family protein [Candidatus Binatia bacterium]|jgi:ornithine cyclodeaminase/alanine dehydrogenase-like protein (mu-crystallin family)